MPIASSISPFGDIRVDPFCLEPSLHILIAIFCVGIQLTFFKSITSKNVFQFSEAMICPGLPSFVLVSHMEGGSCICIHPSGYSVKSLSIMKKT